jgi:hypothetical protein
MNFLKLSLGLIAVTALFVLSTTQFTACTKTKTAIIHDTTTVTKHDTTTVTKVDTLVVVDSVIDLKDGLVAYYNFDNGSLNDGSGYGNNITFNNATPTTDRFGNANSAYLFDGTTSYMQVPNSASLNPSNLTLMAIFKVNGFYTGPCHGNNLMSKGYPDGINGWYVLRFGNFGPDCNSPVDTSHELFLGGITGVGGAADTPMVKTGQWYNLIFTYDGIVSNLYLNGQLKKSWAGTASFATNSHDLFIGKHEDPSFPYYFNGVIDEIRIYNEALPLNVIKKLSD